MAYSSFSVLCDDRRSGAEEMVDEHEHVPVPTSLNCARQFVCAHSTGECDKQNVLNLQLAGDLHTHF
jgi:hypothetical protein